MYTNLHRIISTLQEHRQKNPLKHPSQTVASVSSFTIPEPYNCETEILLTMLPSKFQDFREATKQFSTLSNRNKSFKMYFKIKGFIFIKMYVNGIITPKEYYKIKAM